MEPDVKKEIYETIERRIDRANREAKSPKLGLLGVGITIVLHGVGIVAFITSLSARLDSNERLARANQAEIHRRSTAIITVQFLREEMSDMHKDIKEIRKELRRR